MDLCHSRDPQVSMRRHLITDLASQTSPKGQEMNAAQNKGIMEGAWERSAQATEREGEDGKHREREEA